MVREDSIASSTRSRADEAHVDDHVGQEARGGAAARGRGEAGAAALLIVVGVAPVGAVLVSLGRLARDGRLDGGHLRRREIHDRLGPRGRQADRRVRPGGGVPLDAEDRVQVGALLAHGPGPDMSPAASARRVADRMP